MSWVRRRWLPLAVLVAASAALVASLVMAPGTVWNAGSGPGSSVCPMGPMMVPAVRADGPVRDLDGATRAAGRFGDRWGPDVAEVMQFGNGFYAELADHTGTRANEVLIDPGSGLAQVEWGPAMMWNTRYGGMGAAYPTMRLRSGPSRPAGLPTRGCANARDRQSPISQPGARQAPPRHTRRCAP